ncbi:MAG: shikimate dehydrogenase, partial [Rubrivivax sp.]|nr:shikimate dehydrogenase [Rubrivivax sp.]
MNTPAPDRYAVIGNPVAHSQSPFIHAAFALQTGEAIDYGRLLCPLDGFDAAVAAFAAGGARGCNITMPFKFDAPKLAAQVTPRAALAQAANILRFDNAAQGGWLADNTDGIGLVRDIEIHAGRPLAGTRVLRIGAGGGAAGVLGPLIEARPAAVVVANRTLVKA